MRVLSTKKRKVAAALGAGAIAVATAGTAIAFWSSSGTGDGTASTSAGETDTLPVTQVSAPSNMAPGVAAGAITATVTNTGLNNAHVSQVVVSIQSVTQEASPPAGTCDPSDYTLSNPIMTTGAGDLAPNAVSGTFSGATLGFNNKLTNQDACKGATVHLHYVAS
jgi:hypothetical protein